MILEVCRDWGLVAAMRACTCIDEVVHRGGKLVHRRSPFRTQFPAYRGLFDTTVVIEKLRKSECSSFTDGRYILGNYRASYSHSSQICSPKCIAYRK